LLSVVSCQAHDDWRKRRSKIKGSRAVLQVAASDAAVRPLEDHFRMERRALLQTRRQAVDHTFTRGKIIDYRQGDAAKFVHVVDIDESNSLLATLIKRKVTYVYPV
jgi:hypothetical protein